MKPTPRQTLPLPISHQFIFQVLINKGLKLKSLICDVPEDASLIKRYARYCKSSVHLQTSLKEQKDDKTLKKIHHKVQYVKSLQIDGIMENEKAHKNIKRFIRQSKLLQSYKTVPNPAFSLRNQVQTERRIQFIFNLQKTTSHLNYKRPQRMITALSRSLRSLVSINGDQESIAFEVNISKDSQSETFSDDIQELNRGLKRISFLDNVTVPFKLRNEAHHFLPLFKVKDIKVRLHCDLMLMTRGKCRRLIENFLLRKSAKLMVLPYSYSWSDLMEMLNFSQQMLENNGSCLSFVDFSFDFHSPAEIRQALMKHLSETNAIWESFIFKFKTNSLDWFNEEKLESLQKMMESLTKEENLSKYESVVFDLIFVSEFSDDLLMKILTKVSSVILSFVRPPKNKKGLKFTLHIDSQGIWDPNILRFLDHFQDVKNSIIFLQLKGTSKEVRNLAQNLEALQEGDLIYVDDDPKDLLKQARRQLEMIERLESENEKIRNRIIQVKAGCFEIMHSEQMNKLESLMPGLVKVEKRIKEGQIKRCPKKVIWGARFSN